MSYDGFLSYSHAASGRLTRAVQLALQKFAKPWYKTRQVRIFRDETSLSANPALWSSIEHALNRSTWFLLVASPDAAASEWVQKEVQWWLANRNVANLLILLVDGEIAWNSVSNDFDWQHTTALPAVLQGRFAEQPLYVDLRWAKGENDLSLRHTRFRTAILDVAAPLNGKPKDELDGDDVRHHKRVVWMAWSAVAALLVLAVATTTAALLAYRQNRIATEQRYEALRQREVAVSRAKIAISRQLASQADNDFPSRIPEALLFAASSFGVEPTFESKRSLLRVLQGPTHLSSVLWGHTRAPFTLAFSPDEKTIASAGWDFVVRLWDVDTRRPIGQPLQAHRDGIATVAFSPHGNLLASGSHDGTIIIWDMKSRSPVRTLKQPSSFRPWTVMSVAFHPNGVTLAAAYEGINIALWDVGTGKLLGPELRGHQFTVQDLAFSPDGRTLASAGDGGRIHLWDVERYRHKTILDVSVAPSNDLSINSVKVAIPGSVICVAFSPDGKWLAAGGDDGKITLWQFPALKQKAHMDGHRERVTSLSFSKDSHLLASSSADKNVMLWDLTSEQPQGQTLAGHRAEVQRVAFSPSGAMLASAGQDNNVILWHAHQILPLAKILTGNQGVVTSVAFSNDSTMVASGGADGAIRLWNASNGKEISPAMQAGGGLVSSVTFVDGNNTLASAVGNHSIVLWDCRTGKKLSTIVGKDLQISAIAVSPNGKTIASAGSGAWITLWDAKSSERIGEVVIGHDRVFELKFAPDGKTLAVGAHDGTVTLLDADTRTIIGSLQGHSHAVWGIAFSHSGKLLATTSPSANGVQLWNLASRASVGWLTGETIEDDFTSVSFSHDDKLLAAGGTQGVQLWDLTSGKPLGKLKGHSGTVWRVAFSPDGQFLVSGGQDRSVIRWSLTGRSWMTQACAMANRNLTTREWKHDIGEVLPYQPLCEPAWPVGSQK